MLASKFCTRFGHTGYLLELSSALLIINWINKETYDSLDAETQKQWYGDSYGYYFYSSFSSDMPELNYDYQPVRDAILDVCNYWMAFGYPRIEVTVIDTLRFVLFEFL